MEVSLVGKKALVGGSSKGIGFGIAKQLAESGASVCLMARDVKKMQQIIESFPSNKYQQHSYLVVDFSDFKSFKNIIEDYFNENDIDILINNTQGVPAGDSLSKSIDDYQIAFDVLFKCVVHTSSIALKRMKDKGWGRIINLTSISVKEPLNYLVLSNTIRAAVVTWGKSLSVDLAPFGITVNSIITGFIDTEHLAHLNEQKSKNINIPVSEILDGIKKSIPSNRLGKPSEMGELATFLASDKASYITGTAIPIDGGFLRSI
ncbi:MAG: SDR family oxidoreductase [Candidatus Marisimplicoccus sp.]|jgi:3-oxoacyl-[acyl-carrier protein] reductase|tara:strand:- start:513 stop:1298 length:786 start_codon:yes stop_codon:yes gene_type:complete